CRRRGHTSHNCPQNGKGGFGGQHQQQAAVCFNCGADDHALRDCRKPMENGGATYATCFVCGQQGHLSSKCPQNKMGVYPKGGCCKVCKSVEHLARDCPVGNISADGSSGEKKNKKMTFADDDEDYVDTGDKTGDALDSFQLGLEGEDDDSEDKPKKSSRSHPKRVKF
ncbi:Zinc knuckle, partial [Phytophthora infestans]